MIIIHLEHKGHCRETYSGWGTVQINFETNRSGHQYQPAMCNLCGAEGSVVLSNISLLDAMEMARKQEVARLEVEDRARREARELFLETKAEAATTQIYKKVVNIEASDSVIQVEQDA